MKPTISKIFFVPTILNISTNELKKNGFVNCYIADSTNEIPYENSVFLLFKPEFPGQFRKFLNREYDRTKSIIADYDKFSGMIVLIYRLNQEFLSDYELIRQSKYSKTSKEFQNLFPKYVNITENGVSRKEVSLQYRIFNKTPDLLMYWSSRNTNFNINNEIWYDFVENNETLSNEILNEVALLNFT